MNSVASDVLLLSLIYSFFVFCYRLMLPSDSTWQKRSCSLSSASLQVTTLGYKSLALIEMTKTGIETRSQFPHLIRQ